MIHTLEQLYLQQLHDLYAAETQLSEALPAIFKAATHKDLKHAFGVYLEQSLQRRHLLSQILTEMGHEAATTDSVPMKVMLQASDEVIRETSNKDVRDAGLIAVAQRIVHYQAAAYGTIVPIIIVLKRKSDRHPMETALRESSEASQLLSQIATRTIHRAAAASYEVAN